MDGIINIYKEAGYTSHDVVAKLRGILKQRKIGHTGTLDPDATGVLPVCLGNATRLCEFMTDKEKEYKATFRFGIMTDTEDMTGTVLETAENFITEKVLQETLTAFLGTYEQVPPMYSAIKVNGKKLYELAREGKIVEREARPVTIYEATLLSVTKRKDGFLETATIRVRCSKGTYIRSLIRDIGTAMQTLACMETLVRTKAGVFTLEHAVSLAQVEAARDAGTVEQLLYPTDAMLAMYPFCQVKPDAERYLYNGNPLYGNQLAEKMRLTDGAMLRVYDTKGQFTGLYYYDEQKKQFRPKTMFFTAQNKALSSGNYYGI